jgi:predicted nuclease with TOPRIM domain
MPTYTFDPTDPTTDKALRRIIKTYDAQNRFNFKHLKDELENLKERKQSLIAEGQLINAQIDALKDEIAEIKAQFQIQE